MNPLYPHPSDEDFERVARLLSGEASPGERAALEQWVSEDPARVALYENLSRDWVVAASQPQVNVEAGWARLKDRIRSDSEPEVIPFRPRAPGEAPVVAPWWRHAGVLRAAAIAVVIVGAGLLYKTVATDPSGQSGAVLASTAATAATGLGERRSIDLADGSQITLAPSSSVTVRVGDSGPREVELSGEAFFRVTHDESRPFIVRTSRAVIEDLGTEFTVRAIGGSAPVRVTVSSGSVAVRRSAEDRANDIVLEPSDMITLPDTGSAVVSRNIDITPFQAWTTGRIVFRNATLAEAIVELERWYAADFQINDPLLLRQHLDVEFNGESLDEVLSVVGRILDVRFVRRGNVVEVAPATRTSLESSAGAIVGDGA